MGGESQFSSSNELCFSKWNALWGTKLLWFVLYFQPDCMWRLHPAPRDQAMGSSRSFIACTIGMQWHHTHRALDQQGTTHWMYGSGFISYIKLPHDANRWHFQSRLKYQWIPITKHRDKCESVGNCSGMRLHRQNNHRRKWVGNRR